MQLIPWTITIKQMRLKWFRAPASTDRRLTYNEVTEKPSKKTKGDQRLTWHHSITRDLKTIKMDNKKAIELFKKKQ